jgi:hypothetical protein
MRTVSIGPNDWYRSKPRVMPGQPMEKVPTVPRSIPTGGGSVNAAIETNLRMICIICICVQNAEVLQCHELGHVISVRSRVEGSD